MHWANQFEALTKATGNAKERRTSGLCSTSAAAQSSEVVCEVCDADETGLLVGCDNVGLVEASSLTVCVSARIDVDLC